MWEAIIQGNNIDWYPFYVGGVVMMIIVLGLINWIATYILCTGHIFEGVRCWIETHLPKKMAYLCRCPLCMGTWVGFAEAAILGGPFHGWYAIIASGLAYKAIGHSVLILHNLAEAKTTAETRQAEFYEKNNAQLPG